MTDFNKMLDSHIKSFEQFGSDINYCLYIAHHAKYGDSK